MATISKRGDRWCVQVRRRGHKSQNATFPTKGMAEAWARKIERELDLARVDIIGRQITAQELLERYRDGESASHKGARWEGNRLNKIVREAPWVGFRCEEITADTLRRWRDNRLSVVSGSTVKREMTLLSAAFTHAMREGWVRLHQNPWTSVIKPGEGRARERVIAMDELTRIVGRLDLERKPEFVRDWAPLVAWFAYETAMRISEILALRTKDVSGRVARLYDTKNGMSRNVPLSTLAVAIVNHVAEDPEEKLFQINEGTLGIYWRKARSIAGITDANFHDLRHTAITRFARSGKFNVLELAAISGHKNLQYLKRYTHLLAEDLAAKM